MVDVKNLKFTKVKPLEFAKGSHVYVASSDTEWPRQYVCKHCGLEYEDFKDEASKDEVFVTQTSVASSIDAVCEMVEKANVPPHKRFP